MQWLSFYPRTATVELQSSEAAILKTLEHNNGRKASGRTVGKLARCGDL